MIRCAGLVPRPADDGGATGEAAARTERPASVLLLAIGIVAVTAGSAELIRIGYVAAMSGIPAIGFTFDAVKSVDDQVTSSVESGVDTEELVAQLNEKGHWATAAPEQGLPELFPELRDQVADMDDVVCTMRLAAGTLSENEKAAAVAARPEAKKPPLPIKYCFKSVCWSEQLGEDYSVTWLLTSHFSHAEGWAGAAASTIVFDKIHAPGGFCAVTGELADGYQG
jgi:hypothetical protein